MIETDEASYRPVAFSSEDSGRARSLLIEKILSDLALLLEYKPYDDEDDDDELDNDDNNDVMLIV